MTRVPLILVSAVKGSEPRPRKPAVQPMRRAVKASELQVRQSLLGAGRASGRGVRPSSGAPPRTLPAEQPISIDGTGSRAPSGLGRNQKPTDLHAMLMLA